MSDQTGGELKTNESTEQTDSGTQSVGGPKPSFLQDPVQTSEATTEPSAAEETETTIPEKFRGKSVEDIVKSYTELESLQGRQASKLSEVLSQKSQAEEKATYLSELVQTLRKEPQQSSQTSDKGAEINEDLNEAFLEKGADVTKQVVREVLGEVLSERDKKQVQKEQDFLKQRDSEITHIAQAELQVLADEMYGDPESGKQGAIPIPIANQMAYIDRTDPDLERLRSDPNLTPERVREETRKVYERAVKEVRAVMNVTGDTPSPEQLEAFNKAQQKAASSTPSDSAKGAQTSSTPDPKIERMKKLGWGFLSERS